MAKTRLHRGDNVKELLFHHVYEKGLVASKARKLLGIPRTTAYNWYQNDQHETEKG